MPILHQAASGAVPECYILNLAPDWSTAPKLSYALKSEQSEGLTGIEYRASAHHGLRLKQSWTATLDAAEAALWRQTLAVLGSVRVACPLWIDAYSTTWLHAPQWSLSWSDAGAMAVNVGAGPYTYPNTAPLLFGRLVERPELIPLGGGLWSLSLTVQEDSPWECRIEPATGSTSTSFIWEPDWSDQLSDVSRDQLRKVELGHGRQDGIAGGDGTPRWGEEAGFTLTRDEAAELLRFWRGHQGSVVSFTVPAWCLPGDPTTLTPANYQARFDKDLLEIECITPEVIATTLKLWQEVSLTGSPPPSQSGSSKAHLYVFTWYGGSTHRLSSWEHSLSWGGHIFTPARIAHDQLRQTVTPLGDECEVSIFADEPGNPLTPMLSGDAERLLSVEIAQVSIAGDGSVTAYNELFTGAVRSCELKEDKLVGHASSFGGVFSRKLPRFFIQRGCNYCLFSTCCTLSQSAWAKTGPISGIAGSNCAFTPGSAPSGDYAQKWFAGGWLSVTGSDGQEHRRAILDCSASGGVWTLAMNRFLPSSCSGQTATVYPGCDGNYATCRGKFANGDNFGGHPYTPAFISTSSGNGQTPAK
jgi:hypothetical protein